MLNTALLPAALGLPLNVKSLQHRKLPVESTKLANITTSRWNSLRAKQSLRRTKYTRVSRCNGNDKFHWNKADYYEVGLHFVHAPAGRGFQGSVLFTRADTEDKSKCLVIGIGGDTLMSIVSSLTGRQSERPMSLNLLWNIMQKAKELDRESWELQRMAVVGLNNGIFYGRLFFGLSPDNIVWDCDCRPSDGLWLALQSKCQLFVHREVWNNSSVPLQSVVDNDDETKPIPLGGSAEENLLQSLQSSVTGISMKASLKSGEDMDGAPLSTLWSDDPEPIKRLKRELGVALAEENYGHAAAIRDHPYMKLHCEIVDKRRRGNEEEAEELEFQLKKMMEAASDES